MDRLRRAAGAQRGIVAGEARQGSPPGRCRQNPRRIVQVPLTRRPGSPDCGPFPRRPAREGGLASRQFCSVLSGTHRAHGLASGPRPDPRLDVPRLAGDGSGAVATEARRCAATADGHDRPRLGSLVVVSLVEGSLVVEGSGRPTAVSPVAVAGRRGGGEGCLAGGAGACRRARTPVSLGWSEMCARHPRGGAEHSPGAGAVAAAVAGVTRPSHSTCA